MYSRIRAKLFIKSLPTDVNFEIDEAELVDVVHCNDTFQGISLSSAVKVLLIDYIILP